MARQQSTTTHQIVQCQICKKSKRLNAVAPAELVRPPIVEIILKEHPDWSHDGFICLPDLHHFRGEYFEDLITADEGELSALEAEVIQSLKHEEALISTNINVEFERRLTLGERAAEFQLASSRPGSAWARKETRG
jgi:hypothetical protein